MADGAVKTEFNIHCGRGSDGVILFGNVMSNLVIALTPIVIAICLGIMYHTVRTEDARETRSKQTIKEQDYCLSRAVAHWLPICSHGNK